MLFFFFPNFTEREREREREGEFDVMGYLTGLKRTIMDGILIKDYSPAMQTMQKC